MRSQQAPLRREQWTTLILGTALLFGLIVRLFPAFLTGFPLNDGGMFHVMIQDLRANRFALPAFTTYNLAQIPYAYPPLGFYIAGLLGSVGIPDLEILRWMPILFNLGSCLAFFLLSERLLKDSLRAAVATLIYTLVPDSFSWQIMGGGLTRALGMLMLLLALYQVNRMFEIGERKYVLLSILFASLAILSHPEAGLATASACMLFWFFFGRNRSGTVNGLTLAAGTFLLTLPWWGRVLSMHGFTPFLNVLHSGEYSSSVVKNLTPLLFSWNLWSAIFHFLVLTGLGWSLYKRHFFLPAWYILPFLVEPRSAPAYAYIPSVLMAAGALTGMLPFLYARIRRISPPDLFEIKGATLLLFMLALIWLMQGGLRGFSIRNTSLVPPLPQQAMDWAADNTPADSRFLLITGNGDSMTDPLQEWFPALARRTSDTTLQGQEWMLGDRFIPYVRDLAVVQECADEQCLENWSDRTGLDYSHVLVERNPATAALLESILHTGRYAPAFQNDAYVIFER